MNRLGVLAGLALVDLSLAGAGWHTTHRTHDHASTEVVVALDAPPLAESGPEGRARLHAEQTDFRRALAERVPDARLRWRYRLVADGFAVVIPAREVSDLSRLPHVQHVYASSGGYVPLDSQGPTQIEAPAVWRSNLETAGQGVKIGIIDTGLDASHPYFDPTGYSMPPGFPKGQRAYTTAKVIVARAFPPPGVTSKYARAPFDPQTSGHGTHVAGIAAGDADTVTNKGVAVSGVAPRAYIGNYKALTRTRFGESPNGNAPELMAAIEAAVADGMDVINLSIGEFETDPSRDVVAHALDAAAAAGVVPVVAAGNEYDSEGTGSVGSPGSSAQAITVGAVATAGKPPTSTHAYFSSVGPTPLSLRLKPDIAAPGVAILSSLPRGWGTLSGTSMAAPFVAGAAALLRERHPSWTVAEIKSALVETGAPARSTNGTALAGPSFVGGGVVSMPAADQPLLFTDPSTLSLGYLSRGDDMAGSIRLDDAGGGAGTWQVSLDRTTAPAGATVVVPSSVDVPGELRYEMLTTDSAAEGDVTGYIELVRGSDERHIPFWGRVTAPVLGEHQVLALDRPGVYTASTQGQPALVSRYRYPDDPAGLGVHTVLAGPELVYRVTIARKVANFGVVVTHEAKGSRVEPRVVAGLDENRLLGDAALPVVGNPYLDSLGAAVPVAGALLPSPGQYAVVFDSPAASGAGGFTFRFWVNDVTPPTARLRTGTVVRGRPILVAVSDRGSGVYPQSLEVTVDGRSARARISSGLVRVQTGGLAAGTHVVRLQISDYQETRNNETVAGILPNTRFLRATVRVRGR